MSYGFSCQIRIKLMIIIIITPNGLSLLGWLMGQAPGTYKMSHKSRAIYSLWRSSPIPSLHEAELFPLIEICKRRDLTASNNHCSRYDMLVALPAVILGEGKSLISKNQGRRGSLVMVDSLSSGGYKNNYNRNPKAPCEYWWMAAVLWDCQLRNLVFLATL